MYKKDEVLNLIEDIFKVEIISSINISANDSISHKIFPYLANVQFQFKQENIKIIEEILCLQDNKSELIALYILLNRDSDIVNNLNKKLQAVSTGGVGISDDIEDSHYFWKWKQYTIGLNKNLNFFNKKSLKTYFTLVLSSYPPQRYIKIE